MQVFRNGHRKTVQKSKFYFYKTRIRNLKEKSNDCHGKQRLMSANNNDILDTVGFINFKKLC
jgi:hypothetical protein